MRFLLSGFPIRWVLNTTLPGNGGVTSQKELFVKNRVGLLPESES